MQDVRNGKTNFDRKVKSLSMSADKKVMSIVSWLENYARDSGEWLPNENHKIQLADFKWAHVRETCMRQLYEKALVVGTGFGSKHPEKNLMSYSQWMTVRKNNCPHIRIRKFKALAKCTECDRLDKLLLRTTGDDHVVVKARKARHTQWFMNERAKKRHHENNALDSGRAKRAMLIEIDGMDHSKTSLPQPSRWNKKTDGLPLLHTHLTGAFQFCNGKKKAIGYLWHDR